MAFVPKKVNREALDKLEKFKDDLRKSERLDEETKYDMINLLDRVMEYVDEKFERYDKTHDWKDPKKETV